MLTAGTRLGNYEILDMIGMGGMGAVYRARHSVLGRIDAVKVLAHHLTLQANFRQRFLHEAKIQAKLRHPNIAEVYDCFSSGDQYCISMEYVDGVPLNRLLCVGVLDESRLRKVFTQILDAMAFSHRQNVVHRDLKGSNLLITPQDEVKIVDFGIAKIIDDQVELTMSLDQLGTTRYMAPEQILNQTISPATDVYALGILLYESVTGHVPFEMFSDYEIKKAHVETKAADPREKAPYVSEPLARLIVDCIRKKPADRPQNAGSLEERFKQIAPLYTESPPVIAEHPTTIRSEGGIFDPHTVKLKNAICSKNTPGRWRGWPPCWRWPC
ncbi:serine/threonine-protein kinase [Oscillatoria laete-virens NRMC-F 0139]|nr:serine/threonine-protein kinase [Oscillatoria laete-virens]MDL5054639.1 serine/threonine-protein kinase [Oscillatoria laete-virens NRMC-F 0139]